MAGCPFPHACAPVPKTHACSRPAHENPLRSPGRRRQAPTACLTDSGFRVEDRSNRSPTRRPREGWSEVRWKTGCGDLLDVGLPLDRRLEGTPGSPLACGSAPRVARTRSDRDTRPSTGTPFSPEPRACSPADPQDCRFMRLDPSSGPPPRQSLASSLLPTGRRTMPTLRVRRLPLFEPAGASSRQRERKQAYAAHGLDRIRSALEVGSAEGEGEEATCQSAACSWQSRLEPFPQGASRHPTSATVNYEPSTVNSS